LLDRKGNLIENLEDVKKSYIKLLIIKEHEEDVYSEENLESLYELSENERVIVDDINSIMKFIVSDLLLLRDDPQINKKLSELDKLHKAIINKTLLLKDQLNINISKTRTKIKNLDVFPKSGNYSAPRIVNIRA